jgi:hypothetical protein
LTHRPQLDLLATTLLEKEVLDAEEVKRLVGTITTPAAAPSNSPNGSSPHHPSPSA